MRPTGVRGGLRLALTAGLPVAAMSLAAVLVQRIPDPHGIGTPLGADLSTLGPSLGWYVLKAGLSACLLAPLIAALAARVGDKPMPLRELFAAAAGAWRLWLAGLFYDLGVALGLILLLIPGVLLSVAWVLYAPAAVLGRAGPFAALSLSLERGRRDWTELLRRIAGPYIFYGVVYALSALPGLLAVLRYLGRTFAATSAAVTPSVPTSAELAHAYLSAPVPAWFGWGLMPLLFAAAQLYLLAALTGAWLALGKTADRQ
ncbi:MAG: hypothetical protein ACRES7_08840 [Gammaproteobacteria bacterium]